jgi:hypothetical protein
VSNRKADADTTDLIGPVVAAEVLTAFNQPSSLAADRPSEARLGLGGYAREVLAAQDTRRFVLGFTLCRSLMRIWEFDRLGWVASEQFDINKDGLWFVSTILGFLWMSEEALGFDPTIMTVKGQRFMEIKRGATTERLVLATCAVAMTAPLKIVSAKRHGYR